MMADLPMDAMASPVAAPLMDLQGWTFALAVCMR